MFQLTMARLELLKCSSNDNSSNASSFTGIFSLSSDPNVVIPMLLENGLYDRAISLLFALTDSNSDAREKGLEKIVRTLTQAWVDRCGVEGGNHPSSIRKVFVIDPSESNSVHGSVYARINAFTRPSSVPSSMCPPFPGMCSLVTSSSCLNYLQHLLDTHSTAILGFRLHAAVIDELLRIEHPLPSWLCNYRTSTTSLIASKPSSYDSLDGSMVDSSDIGHSFAREHDCIARSNRFVPILRAFLSHSRLDLAVPFICDFLNDIIAEQKNIPQGSHDGIHSEFSQNQPQHDIALLMSDELNAIEDCERYINNMVTEVRNIENYLLSTNNLGTNRENIQEMIGLLSSFQDQLNSILHNLI
jgi:hypothetical protein